VATGRQRRCSKAIRNVTFLPDSKLGMSTLGDEAVRFWDIATRAVKKRLEDHLVSSRPQLSHRTVSW
jgi:hypothetical protein